MHLAAIQSQAGISKSARQNQPDLDVSPVPVFDILCRQDRQRCKIVARAKVFNIHSGELFS